MRTRIGSVSGIFIMAVTLTQYNQLEPAPGLTARVSSLVITCAPAEDLQYPLETDMQSDKMYRLFMYCFAEWKKTDNTQAETFLIYYESWVGDAGICAKRFFQVAVTSDNPVNLQADEMAITVNTFGTNVISPIILPPGCAVNVQNVGVSANSQVRFRAHLVEAVDPAALAFFSP